MTAALCQKIIADDYMLINRDLFKEVNTCLTLESVMKGDWNAMDEMPPDQVVSVFSNLYSTFSVLKYRPAIRKEYGVSLHQLRVVQKALQELWHLKTNRNDVQTYIRDHPFA